MARLTAVNRAHMISAARVLARTFASAPDPRLRAEAIVRLIEDAGGLQPPEREAVATFRLWLDTRPSPEQLKARCRALLESLR